ncbi:hypothetical protein PHLCEN_2v10019 [Hermanssonia centrifuga]|uniref:Uncharacterized protein n=1 Tax=Hermanssonia centrifuga TaxID=98765 RepID=A0A2R6NP49_9APHY|nr:hypothetical protein PHLCEN_2v10019 [Hermanssonia centrifuga]
MDLEYSSSTVVMMRLSKSTWGVLGLGELHDLSLTTLSGRDATFTGMRLSFSVPCSDSRRAIDVKRPIPSRAMDSREILHNLPGHKHRSDQTPAALQPFTMLPILILWLAIVGSSTRGCFKEERRCAVASHGFHRRERDVGVYVEE